MADPTQEERLLMRHAITRSTVLALAAVFSLALAGSSAQAEEAKTPLIVKIHADWCGTCQKLEPTFEELEQQVGSDARIVVLDVSDRDAVARSSAEADRLGIREFFDAYKGKTGTVGVLAADGKPVSVMKGELDTSKYLSAVKKAKQESTS
jgi:thiol-disulfide isomerase/thioredoxin